MKDVKRLSAIIRELTNVEHRRELWKQDAETLRLAVDELWECEKLLKKVRVKADAKARSMLRNGKPYGTDRLIVVRKRK